MDQVTRADWTLPGRINQVGREAEGWRPLAFERVTTRKARVAAAARRFLDLQAGSVWNDLVKLLPEVRGKVLDVGCGAQPFRHLLPPGVAYQGIDYAGAEAHFGYKMPDTTYYSGDVWPVEDASVDVILTTETMEHVPDPVRFLDEAARCLKPGGRIILTVPFAARWHYIPHDYWRYTPSALDRLLQAAGFTEVAVYARGNEITVAAYKAMALLLPFLIPQGKPWPERLLRLAWGLLVSPLVLILGGIGTLSIQLSQGGSDCLGYTATARKL